MSNSARPHRRQPTRLPCTWDSPGKNTGVGCHFLLQCMKVKSEREVAQSCPTLRYPMDRSLPGSSAHGIFQARVLEWGAIAFSVVFSYDPLIFKPACNLSPYLCTPLQYLLIKALPSSPGLASRVPPTHSSVPGGEHMSQGALALWHSCGVF